MSSNSHSISAVSTAKKFKTPLKASVVLLTSLILAACNTTDDPSYNFNDVFAPVNPEGGETGGGETGGGETGGGETGGGETGGGETGGGETGGGETGGGEVPAPESKKTGVQSINIDPSAAGIEVVFNTPTREFDINEDGSVVGARADLASKLDPEEDALLPIVAVNISGDNDTSLENGFKSHKDSTNIETSLGELPLTYTSVYKDYSDDMRIAHIDGDAEVALLEGAKLPVNGVAVIGNATKADNMPTEGKVGYTGDATYRELGLDKTIEYGSSVFTADFVAKNVKGDLTFDKAGKIGLTAGINGNQISGAAVDNGGYTTEGGFFGDDAKYLGGIYEGNGAQGTYGANKDKVSVDPVDPTPEAPKNPDVKPDSEMTGFQSTSLSSVKQNVAGTQLDDAIGYVAIRDDKSDFTATEDKDGSNVPVDNRKGDNFTSFDKGVVRADMVKPDNVLGSLAVDLTKNGSVMVDAGKGPIINPKFNYTAVYKNFESQMQVGHIYGDFKSLLGPVSRAANVYVQGHLTNQQDIDYLKQVNDGKAQYQGVATYIENIHLGDEGEFKPVDGTSAFNVDFVGGKVDGTLSFTGTDYKYMPDGNQIKINADITGNTFAGNVDGIDTAGGFYGEDAKFLGGIYQDASVQGGKGTVPGTGTTFQGTFGAEKVVK